jgi:hypothetical protein
LTPVPLAHSKFAADAADEAFGTGGVSSKIESDRSNST